MEKITKRQKQLLEIIYNYIKDTGYPPTFKEMRESLDVVSNQSIIDLLVKLEKQKLLKKNESSARSLIILPLGNKILKRNALIPLLGSSSAGSPIDALEISGEWQEISTDVAQLKEDVFLLKIIGDSMINANIENGDAILVQNKKEFISGDIVLANVAGDRTVKRFISDDKPPYLYLKPENPKYKNIPFEDNMEIIGKVISVFKKGYWKSVK
ncbi:MAG: repressor LexA [Candidatus Staskawiczbacteria bacterium RIFCSPLOWO2_12_FULL_37_15]|uniref:Repressor LexA n=1 Tax=Candidatus Staskawiczbacteria bacterium RIFCSPLOWO2_12_FULL_37_15 TaxID=1802218 RepID=A0A1G2IKQ1_9BACT|nr:MAG: LexA repressor [Parcubacteria group bacterium GW2011_GWA2_37_10]OGZ75434.1 MAG: repressor LexA [Candidatus Staskawiczbacteria bacterium RIFCSPLOWO2_12_FULL_37_15]HLD38239.1 transcriptional repressor LexA [Candidatus Nanoarchaeia archaeon]